MPTLIRFAGTIPNVTGPTESNERLDDDFDSYDASCEIAPVTSPGTSMRLRVRIRPDTIRTGITVECEISGKEAELYRDVTDLPLDGLDEDVVQGWIENALAGAYQRFCELEYPPISR